MIRTFIRSGFVLALLLLPLASFAQAQPNVRSSDIELDYSAVSMAQQILDPQQDHQKVTQALDLAVVLSQFNVRQADGSTSMTTGQGLYMDSWNIEAMSMAMSKGVSQTLDDYLLMWQLSADAVHGPLPESAVLDSVFRQKFLEDISEAANLSEDDTSGLRFMIHLIIALGREDHTNSYDLLDTNVSGSVRLNIVQMYLLTHRMSAEFWVRAQEFKPQSLAIKPLLASPLHAASRPCTMTETQALVMDGAAAGSGAILGGVQFAKGALDHLQVLKFISEEGLEKFNKMSSTANISLNYLKFAITMAAFKASMKANPNPLVRTKNTNAGGDSIVAAQFKLDVGNAQIVNCLRPALNAVGIDFSLPQDGPLVGSLVEWAIQSRVGAANDVLQTLGDPILAAGSTKRNIQTANLITKKSRILT